MPRRKALKVSVDVHLHAITCPGVFLPEQSDVFVNIELLSQRKRSKNSPPVFPFLFHEKLRFDKVFTHATDPVQVANALSSETVRIELIQLSYPGGELLATYQENAREFLFPTPRVSPTYPGVDREVLLQRSSSFPGIAPKLEFSSRTIIKEVTSAGRSRSSHLSKSKRDDGKHKSNTVERLPSQVVESYQSFERTPAETSTPAPAKPTDAGSKSKRKSKDSSRTSRSRTSKTALDSARSASVNSKANGTRRYEQSTISSRARSPSPYTRRRMAQLSIKDPFESTSKAKPFKTEIGERPEFVIRKANREAACEPPPPLPPVSPDRNSFKASLRKSISPSPSHVDALVESALVTTEDLDKSATLEDTAELVEQSVNPAEESNSRPSSSHSTSAPAATSIEPKLDREDLTASPAASSSRLNPNSILYRTPLRERFNVGDPSPYDKIRDRVRNILTSPRATRILDESITEASERYWKTRSQSASPRSPPTRERSADVYLGNGNYWNERASEYTGQSHRNVFEDSIDKIISDVYKRHKEESSTK